jgi:hypothetical protein
MLELRAVQSMRQEWEKIAADLTEAARADLPKKDFAVSAKKSNTGDKAYPIPDRQHAASALGFAKMHHDSADLAAVRAKIKEKYPDMLSKAAGEALKKFISGAKGELGPAVGATLGAGVGKMVGIDPLAGAAAGYGIGALPEIIHGVQRHRAKIGPPVGP